MKKLVYVAAIMVAAMFASCNNRAANAESTENDSIAVDTTIVVDSLPNDSAAVDSLEVVVEDEVVAGGEEA